MSLWKVLWACLTVAVVVVEMAPIWMPLLLGVVGLLVVSRCCRGSDRHCYGHGPDVSGPCPGCTPDNWNEGE
ncbi:hypothetical protein [Streptomyces inusitatus]|uniref:hypothetical protein n=1 Tax=Streptomyces inusitatus TaxID=68221 RepID=UPI00167E7FDA|nr:hypothetical protein [Streptomyces inusitatus]